MSLERTYCGEVTESDCGNEILLNGWVDTKRDLGGLIFLKLRDVSGLVQIICETELAENLKSEYVISIKGNVRKRTEENINTDMKTGTIEVVANAIIILNESLPIPFQIDKRDKLQEETRLKYRFLDLRREEMQDAIIKRHVLMQTCRNFLTKNRFFEIETPILNKSTPEGARDFLVPSRMTANSFYALPQSPQLFKQILMISGFDRYFQIVKCFRDEDLRNDRQPEFTQIDMELSFANPDIIISIIEGLLKEIVKDVVGKGVRLPFNRITYDESMSRFGCDAPDTRFDLELKELSEVFANSEFKVFSSALKSGIIKGFSAPDDGSFSRKKTDMMAEQAKLYHAGGLPFVKFNEGDFEGGIAKFLNDNEREALKEIFSLKDKSIIFFSADKKNVVNQTLSKLRKFTAEESNLIDNNKMNFIWIMDFPLFDYDEDNGRFNSIHHPFTAPKADQIKMLETLKPSDTDIIKSDAYDIVLNGSEIGGGSIRISNPEIQSSIFNLLGISPKEAKEKFSFLLEALKYGAPPHGGIALGLDRIMMMLLQKDSIRDVIPFPKTTKGQCLMSNAPSPVANDQLEELHIKISQDKKED